MKLLYFTMGLACDNHVMPAVIESEEPDWLKASRADGRKGLVPANYVELLS